MKEQLPLRLPVDRAANLNDYVGGLADKVASLKGIVFLTGPEGTGKTHLLQARYRQDLQAGQNAFCLSGLQRHSPALLDDLDQASTVCLDDIDAVISLPEWQAPLYRLINGMNQRRSGSINSRGGFVDSRGGFVKRRGGLLNSRGTLLLASRQKLAELKIPLADLRSRVRAAYLLNAEALDDQQKLEVIRRKAQRRGFAMSDEVCRFILERSPRDMHHLAHLVARLDAETLRRQKKVTIPFVKSALGL